MAEAQESSSPRCLLLLAGGLQAACQAVSAERFCLLALASRLPTEHVSGYTFFSQLCPGQTPGRILTVYGLNDARMCLLKVRMTTHNFKGFKRPKNPQKGGMVGIFQPNWQNYKIAISPAGKIGSTPNFDRIIEPHS